MFCICELESLSQKLQWDYNFVLWCFRTWQRAGWFYEQFRGKRASPKKYHHRKFFFNHVEQVKEHLEQKHLDKSNWVYKVVSEDHLEEIRKQPREEFKILQCKKLRIIAFFPDGWIMRKEKICYCYKCLNGDLDKCEFEPDRIIKKGDVNSEDDKIHGWEYEENEILKELFFSHIEKGSYIKESFFSHIEKGSYVALYSPPQTSELFYLRKVLSCETATTSISDANYHIYCLARYEIH